MAGRYVAAASVKPVVSVVCTVPFDGINTVSEYAPALVLTPSNALTPSLRPVTLPSNVPSRVPSPSPLGSNAGGPPMGTNALASALL